MIIALPDVLIRSIFSFLTHDETLKAAALCRRLHDHVEAFSGEQLNNIRETHQVDPSWNYRLGMQVNIPRERQPPTLSNRHMLKVARQTHLYTLSDRDCTEGVNCLLCLPDGNTLISAGTDNLIRVWDLTTQRCVRSFGAFGIAIFFALHFVAGRIVSVSRDAIMCIWKLDGTLLHEINFGRPWIRGSASCGNHFFYSSFHQDDDGTFLISVVDVLSGERVREKVHEWSGYSVKDMAVKGEWLLVLVHNDNEEEENYEAPSGIHALKQSDLVEESVFPGNFLRVACPEESEYIVATSESGEMSLFLVDDSGLVRIRSFAANVPVSRYDPLLVSGSFIYTTIRHARDEEDQFINVFDINSGEQVRRLNFPTVDTFTGAKLYPWTIASNGHEVFCAFIIGDFHRSVSTIKAFLAW